MLSRIAYELFWIGRYCARAEHTARVLDGVFRTSLQARPDDPEGVTLSWDAVLAMTGAATDGRSTEPADTATVIRLLTLEPTSPASVVACIARAREGCRTVREVISAEMWEALNALHLELLDTDLPAAVQNSPHSVYSLIKERCALFWGLAEQTMLRDQARAFLDAGRQIETADMVLRMLLVSLPARRVDPAEAPRRRSPPTTGRRSRCCTPSAASRPSAGPRWRPRTSSRWQRFCSSSSGTPTRCPPPSSALHESLRHADPRAHESPAVLRLRRLMADLEFRRGSIEAAGLAPLVTHVRRELHLADADIRGRYFAGAELQSHILTA